MVELTKIYFDHHATYACFGVMPFQGHINVHDNDSPFFKRKQLQICVDFYYNEYFYESL